MEKLTIQDLRDRGWIVYEYMRGSHAYGLAIEGQSDIDIGGVFVIPQSYLMGLRSNYIEQVADEKNDTVFYEFGRWIELLLKSNPSALESLFIPKQCIIGEPHPMIQYIIDNRDSFLSKECIKTTCGYAASQIYKARGLNKKIVNPITERKNILDFCYVPYNNGSIPFNKFLEIHGLIQDFCGLSSIPNMRDLYHVFYDWESHRQKLDNENASKEDKINFIDTAVKLGQILEPLNYIWGYNNALPNIICDRYKGICNPNDYSKSNEVRLSSIPKGAIPICQMSYNKDGYSCHCVDYKNYKDWEKNRNPIRYESNLNQNYDSKNLSHCMRLIRMGKELANGEGFNVYRTNDRDYLLDIRNHKFEYDEIIKQADKEKLELDEALKTCTLPDKIDSETINELLIRARKFYYCKGRQ